MYSGLVLLEECRVLLEGAGVLLKGAGSSWRVHGPAGGFMVLLEGAGGRLYEQNLDLHGEAGLTFLSWIHCPSLTYILASDRLS